MRSTRVRSAVPGNGFNDELGMSEPRKLGHLEDDNARLRHIVDDLMLDKLVLQEVVKECSEGWQALRACSPDADALQGQCVPLVAQTPTPLETGCVVALTSRNSPRVKKGSPVR